MTMLAYEVCRTEMSNSAWKRSALQDFRPEEAREGIFFVGVGAPTSFSSPQGVHSSIYACAPRRKQHKIACPRTKRTPGTFQNRSPDEFSTPKITQCYARQRARFDRRRFLLVFCIASGVRSLPRHTSAPWCTVPAVDTRTRARIALLGSAAHR